MKKLLEIALGLVTAIGGFLEAGSIATAAQAGAAFGHQLAWAILLGTLCLICLVEMSGRFAAVSHHTVIDAIRERFGMRAFAFPLLLVAGVSLMVLASEIASASLALSWATGVNARWFGFAVALLGWALIWVGSFSLIEKGAALLGLVAVSFVVAAHHLGADPAEVARALVPSKPTHDKAEYWFMVVSILGASVSPYLYFFYSAGAIEDGWNEEYVAVNRVIAVVGMLFGGALSIAVLAGAAQALHPLGMKVEIYEQVVLPMTAALGHRGFQLFLASLGICCFGAAVEIALAIAHLFAQGRGGQWGESLSPRASARYSLVYTVVLPLAALPTLLGVDAVKLTVVSMALTAASLPVSIVPFLVIMNDPTFLGTRRNGPLMNAAAVAVIVVSLVLALVAIPLQLVGG